MSEIVKIILFKYCALLDQCWLCLLHNFRFFNLILRRQLVRMCQTKLLLNKTLIVFKRLLRQLLQPVIRPSQNVLLLLNQLSRRYYDGAWWAHRRCLALVGHSLGLVEALSGRPVLWAFVLLVRASIQVYRVGHSRVRVLNSRVALLSIWLLRGALDYW